LATEFCERGELLKKILDLNYFSEQIVSRIMKQLLSAVTYCRSKHIIHKDLKLENLVLETNDIESNLKVIDFGTCKIFKPKEIMKEITGSVNS
jgi:calcium-dependent protein kinase